MWGFGRNVLDSCRTEDLIQSFHHGVAARFGQSCHYALEGGAGLGSPIVFRALGYLPGDHRRPQRPFGPIVGRLNARVLQEPPQIAPVVVPANLVPPPLVVPVPQDPVPGVIGNRLLQTRGFGGQVLYPGGRIPPPPLPGLLQQPLELIAEALPTASPPLGLPYCTD